MARYRTIKPEFWTSEQVVECSTNARLLFVGLWNFCDDNGVHPYSAKRIKMEVFPGDDFSFSQIDAWIGELLRVGLLKSYTVNGDSFLVVTGWHHQRIDKPTKKFPTPDEADSPREFDDRSENAPREVGEQSPQSRKEREEGSREEGSGKEPRRLRFDEEDVGLANWMFGLIQAMQPDRKQPNLDAWANTFRLMRENDGRAPPEIRSLFEWCNRDAFWRTNILSPDKLREKWDDLQLRRKNNSNGTSKPVSAGKQYDPNAECDFA